MIFYIYLSHAIQHKLEKRFNFSSLLPNMLFNALLETFIYWCVLCICITHQYKIVAKELLDDNPHGHCLLWLNAHYQSLWRKALVTEPHIDQVRH